MQSNALFCSDGPRSWFQATITMSTDGNTVTLHFIGFPDSSNEIVLAQSGQNHRS